MMALVSSSQANSRMVFNGYSPFNSNSPSDSGQNKESSSLQPGGEDKLSLSGEARALSEKENRSATVADSEDATAGKNTIDSTELTMEEQAQLQQLKHRDAEVRTHEQAHMAAAGQYSRGGPSFSLKKGPDGKDYAIGGEVNIDIGKEKTPEETVAKMRIISQAALAPANPSSADRRIAAQASVKEAQARQEISASQQEDLLASEKQTDHNPHPRPEAPETVITNAAPGDSVGTLKTMVEAYIKVAAY